MAALATSSDVEASLGRTLTDEESAKADSALNAASAFVRSKTRRLYEAGPRTVTRRARKGKVWLDSPVSVTTVTQVFDDGSTSDLTGWTLRGERLYGVATGSFQNTFSHFYHRAYTTWVEVAYVADGEVPFEVVEIVAAIAGRLITSPAVPGVSYEIAGPFARGFSKEAASAVALPNEVAVLKQHAAPPVGAVSLL